MSAVQTDKAATVLFKGGSNPYGVVWCRGNDLGLTQIHPQNGEQGLRTEPSIHLINNRLSLFDCRLSRDASILWITMGKFCCLL